MSSVMEFWGHTSNCVYAIANTKKGNDWNNIRDFCKVSEGLTHFQAIQYIPECPEFKNEVINVRYEMETIHGLFEPVKAPQTQYLGIEAVTRFVDKSDYDYTDEQLREAIIGLEKLGRESGLTLPVRHSILEIANDNLNINVVGYFGGIDARMTPLTILQIATLNGVLDDLIDDLEGSPCRINTKPSARYNNASFTAKTIQDYEKASFAELLHLCRRILTAHSVEHFINIETYETKCSNLLKQDDEVYSERPIINMYDRRMVFLGKLEDCVNIEFAVAVIEEIEDELDKLPKENRSFSRYPYHIKTVMYYIKSLGMDYLLPRLGKWKCSNAGGLFFKIMKKDRDGIYNTFFDPTEKTILELIEYLPKSQDDFKKMEKWQLNLDVHPETMRIDEDKMVTFQLDKDTPTFRTKYSRHIENKDGSVRLIIDLRISVELISDLIQRVLKVDYFRFQDELTVSKYHKFYWRLYEARITREREEDWLSFMLKNNGNFQYLLAHDALPAVLTENEITEYHAYIKAMREKELEERNVVYAWPADDAETVWKVGKSREDLLVQRVRKVADDMGKKLKRNVKPKKCYYAIVADVFGVESSLRQACEKINIEGICDVFNLCPKNIEAFDGYTEFVRMNDPEDAQLLIQKMSEVGTPLTVSF